MECNDRSQSAKLARTEDPRSRPQWNYDVLVYLVQICISKNTVPMIQLYGVMLNRG